MTSTLKFTADEVREILADFVNKKYQSCYEVGKGDVTFVLGDTRAYERSPESIGVTAVHVEVRGA